jgi:hypothetical protein
MHLDRLAAQQLLLEFGDGVAGVEAELIAQPGPVGPDHLERLGRAVGHMQRSCGRDGDVLAQRDVSLQAQHGVDRCWTIAGEQVGLGQDPARVDAQILQPKRVRASEILGELGVSAATPLGQRVPEGQRRCGRVVDQLGAGLLHGPFEGDRIDLDLRHIERVARRSCEDRAVADERS